MSDAQHDDVRTFHLTFGHPVREKPQFPDPDLLTLRRVLIAEEHAELQEALHRGDRTGIADALVDIAYIGHGSLHACGLRYNPTDTFGLISLDEAMRAHLTADTLVQLQQTLWAVLARCRTTADLYSIPFDAVWNEVHAANMRKVWPDGTVHYREDGKVIKPPNFRDPDIAGVLAAHTA